MEMTQIFSEIPLQGGRDILQKQFFSDYLSVSSLNALGTGQEILWGSQYATLGKLVLMIIEEAMIKEY